MRMTPLPPLIPLEEARRRLLAAATPVERTEMVPLSRAVGRVVARDLKAARPIPAFARATWDGYALRSAGTRSASKRSPLRFTLIGEVHAEEQLGRSVGKGECVAVATGAPLPKGADAVVIFEEVKQEEGAIVLSEPVARGSCIAEPGEDVRKGELLVRRGEVLTPARIGAVAATGAGQVHVYAKPLVVLVPNGNELVRPGGSLRPGQIREFNNLTLGALVSACGGEALMLDPVPDDPSTIQGTLEGALRSADLVISTGGSSVGERDFLPKVFPKIGTMLFHGIRVRPGKPTLAARAGKKLLVGMPGHPTSCLSNGYWLLLPLLRKMAHLPGAGWVDVPARLGKGFRSPSGGFATVLPVRLQNGIAHPTFHGSSAITSLTGSSGFLLLPPKVEALPRGATVTVHRLLPPLAP